jgi:YHS domain-containing protein
MLVSAPAFASEPATLPRSADNAALDGPTPSFTPKAGIIADGVPVEAVLGGDVQGAAWVAGGGSGEAALGGLDPVSFFEPSGPKRGKAEFRAEYHGAVYHFTSERHRAQFVNAPELYAPAFGGYDPEALAAGSLLPSDPQNWTIFDGRLFLSGSPDLKSEFDRHKPEVIKAAQDKWKAVDEMFEDRFFKAHQD